MKDLQKMAGAALTTEKTVGYDPEKLLRNPRLSPEMVWQLRNSMSRYHLDEGLMAGTDATAGPDRTTARVVRGFDSSDRLDLPPGPSVQM